MKNKIITGLFAIAALGSITLTACEEKKGKAEVDNKGVDIEGKHGGELEIDKKGLEIEGRHGGGVEVRKGDVDVRVSDKGKDVKVEVGR